MHDKAKPLAMDLGAALFTILTLTCESNPQPIYDPPYIY